MKIVKQQLTALKGLTLPTPTGDVRVEAGDPIPTELVKVIPEEWYGTKVEET